MKYFEYPIADNVIALTTTREVGNMAFHLNDNYDEVLKRRKEVADHLKIELPHLVFTHQSHSDIIKEVTNADFGRGSYAFEEGIEADALYTKERGLAIGVFHADCVPIFFYDSTIPLVGIIHAGFEGTLKHIAFKAIKQVIAKENLKAENLKFYFGPSRHKQSYPLLQAQKEEVIVAGCPLFDDHFDMVESNKFDLICANIPLDHIHDININTVTSQDCYSAYLKTPAGRMASIILLK